jgi:hypothetical protein
VCDGLDNDCDGAVDGSAMNLITLRGTVGGDLATTTCGVGGGAKSKSTTASEREVSMCPRNTR